MLRHNLDVMHIEKNVTENIVGTLLNIKQKTKDSLKSHKDFRVQGLTKDLHPQTKPPSKMYFTPACFTMSNKEKQDFLNVIKNVKVVDGYASNLSHCVKIKQCIIVDMKSHACHILMQQFMPIALCISLLNKVSGPLIELSCLFREFLLKCSNKKTWTDLRNEHPISCAHYKQSFR